MPVDSVYGEFAAEKAFKALHRGNPALYRSSDGARPSVLVNLL